MRHPQTVGRGAGAAHSRMCLHAPACQAPNYMYTRAANLLPPPAPCRPAAAGVHAPAHRAAGLRRQQARHPRQGQLVQGGVLIERGGCRAAGHACLARPSAAPRLRRAPGTKQHPSTSLHIPPTHEGLPLRRRHPRRAPRGRPRAAGTLSLSTPRCLTPQPRAPASATTPIPLPPRCSLRPLHSPQSATPRRRSAPCLPRSAAPPWHSWPKTKSGPRGCAAPRLLRCGGHVPARIVRHAMPRRRPFSHPSLFLLCVPSLYVQYWAFDGCKNMYSPFTQLVPGDELTAEVRGSRVGCAARHRCRRRLLGSSAACERPALPSPTPPRLHPPPHPTAAGFSGAGGRGPPAPPADAHPPRGHHPHRCGRVWSGRRLVRCRTRPHVRVHVWAPAALERPAQGRAEARPQRSGAVPSPALAWPCLCHQPARPPACTLPPPAASLQSFIKGRDEEMTYHAIQVGLVVRLGGVEPL